VYVRNIMSEITVMNRPQGVDSKSSGFLYLEGGGAFNQGCTAVFN
jgi:hypothetical protein